MSEQFEALSSDDTEADEIQFDPRDQKTVEEISEFLDEVVRPQIAMDGGDIKLKAYERGIAYLHIRGASSSSPISSASLYQAIRQTLIENIAELVDIELV